MAALTWKNIGQTQFDTGGINTALTALKSGSESLTGAAQTFADQAAKDKARRLEEATYGLKDLASLEAAKAGAAPEGFDIGTWQRALGERRTGLITERDQAATESMRGFDSGISLDKLGQATLVGQQAKLDDLQSQIDAIPGLTPNQRKTLFEERKGLLGVTPERNKQLAYEASLITDPTTGTQILDPAKFQENMANLGFGPEARTAYTKALKRESGQDLKEAAAADLVQRELNLKYGAKEQTQKGRIEREAEYANRGSAKNLESTFDRLTDTDFWDADARQAAMATKQAFIGKGYHPNVVYDAVLAGIESEDADFDIGAAEAYMSKAVKDGYATTDLPYGKALTTIAPKSTSITLPRPKPKPTTGVKSAPSRGKDVFTNEALRTPIYNPSITGQNAVIPPSITKQALEDFKKAGQIPR